MTDKVTKWIMIITILTAFSACQTSGITPVTKTTEAQTKYDKNRIEFTSTTDMLDYVHILDQKPDPQITVWGNLYMPQGSGPFPCMVMIHGSGGIMPKNQQWVDLFLDMGVAVFQLDSFTPRGIRSNATSSGSKGTGAVMISDAYHALKNVLYPNPKIDNKNIGVIGNSRGGGAAFLTAWEPIAEKLGGEQYRFSLHISLYPICADFENWEFTGAPILILAGGKDESTPASACVNMVQMMKRAGYPAQCVVFPDAYHAFDDIKPVKHVNLVNSGNCRYIITENGGTVEKTTGISLSDPENRKRAFKECGASVGAKSGMNKEAKEESMRLVRQAIKEHLM